MRAFVDRVAVVTGAGSGIGRALAIELAERGCDLALTDLDPQRLAEVAAAARAKGRTVSEHAFDVADRAAWPGFVDALRAAHGGRLNLVVNNAGVVWVSPFDGRPDGLDQLDWQLGVNLFGVIYGCHFLLPLLEAQPAGSDVHLVNLSSIFGVVSMPEHAGYCMAKHAVRSLSEVLEMELWDTPIRVTSVHPGAVATRIAADGRYGDGGAVDVGFASRMIERGMPPERAARIIVDGIARDKARILVGADAWGLMWLQRLLPVAYRGLFVRRIRKIAAGRAAREAKAGA